MRLRDLLRRSLARSDVQTAWIISAALALSVLVPGAFFYVHLAAESLREVDRWFDFAVQVAVREIDEHGVDALAGENVRGRLPNPNAAVRLRAPGGELLYERGKWPDPAHQVR